MKILALEFSSEHRSVAILQTEANAPSSRAGVSPAPERGIHSAGAPDVNLSGSEAGVSPAPVVSISRTAPRTLNAFHLIETTLGKAGLQLEQIDCLAVGIGPGSYTGIRAAISIAQGWQIARGVKLLAISSVDCLAARAHAEGIFGRVHLVIDAQRNEFYLASYKIEPAGLRLIEPLRLATFNEVSGLAKTSSVLVGPEVDRWFPQARVLSPDAGALAKLAAGRADFVSGEKLEPIYLRETNFVKAPPPRILQ